MARHQPAGIDRDAPCFFCNTNHRRVPEEGGRDNDGGFRLERLMGRNDCAVTWWRFAYPDHMHRVAAGDTILMYARGDGVIGVGRAREGVRVLPVGDPARIDRQDIPTRWPFTPWPGDEWQIRVEEWHRWQPGHPCMWPGHVPQCSFLDVSGPGYADQRRAVWRHFNL